MSDLTLGVMFISLGVFSWGVTIGYFIGKTKDINEIQRMAGKPAFKVN